MFNTHSFMSFMCRLHKSVYIQMLSNTTNNPILLITRLATRNTATNASAGGQVSIECAEKHKNADNIRTKLFPR